MFVKVNLIWIVSFKIYHGAANDAVLALERDQRVRDFNVDLAILTGFNIPQISSVATTLGVGGGSVLASVDVEVRAGRGTAVGVVPKLVDVEPMLTRCQSGDFSGHSDWTITLNRTIKPMLLVRIT